MTYRSMRPAVSLLLSALLSCAPIPAQTQGTAHLAQGAAALAQARMNAQFQAPVRPDPKVAQKAVERGAKAEAEGRIDDALIAYDEAARFAPQDMAILGRGAVLRSKLIRDHVDNAERLALEGKIAQATEELHVAMRIDPNNTIVAERLGQMESMTGDEAPARVQTPIAGMPRLNPQNAKHSFDLRGDTKTIYEQVAQAFGIKAAFDPDLTPRNVRFRLDEVDFNTAIAVLGAETATFWRPLDATMMFIAPDTIDKRKQFGLQAEQTFPLAASVEPGDMTELLRVLREITGASHIELDTRSRTITIRDSPSNLALAGEIIRQVERARGEVMLEIELLEVDRNKAQQLGITPPSSAQAFLLSTPDIRALEQSADLANALTILGQIFSAKGFSSVPPFTIVGGGYTTFLLTLPAAAANFSDALTLVQSGRQVLLRAQNGKPATFFVGDRFPVTLSLLSNSLGAGSGTGIPGAANSGLPFTGIPTSTTFPETSFNVGNNPAALVSADFNGDSLPDLAVANQNDNTISILLNQDNGNFISAPNPTFVLAKNETAPAAIASGILRNNTINPATNLPQTTQDLVIANSTSNNVTVLFGNGDGTFREAPGSPYAVGKNPRSLVLADFNGDGNLDFAVINKTDSTISLFKGDGSGNFTEFPGSPFALPTTEQGPVAMVTGNFRNGSFTTNINPHVAAEVDLAVVNQTTNNVSILLGSVDRGDNVILSEAVNSPVPVGQSPVAIATADLSADGVLDLAVVNQADNSVSILLGSTNLNATFTAAVGSPLPTATTPAGIAIANFTGTFPSLAVTNKGQGTLGIYLGLGSGTFSNRLEIQTPPAPNAIITSTLTTSGLPDVALTSESTTAGQGLVTIIQDSSNFAAAGGAPGQIPYPGSEYIDLGVKVKATPTVHPDHDVTLQLEFEIRALSGANINGIPVISNRTLSQTVRVKEDETTMIGGLLDKEETRAIAGLPGLATVPGAGYAFGNRNNSLQDNEFLILITPRRLRSPIRSAPSISAGHGETPGHGVFIPNGPEQPNPPPRP